MAAVAVFITGTALPIYVASRGAETVNVKEKTATVKVAEKKPRYPLPGEKEVCSCESTGSPHNEPRQFEADGSPLYSRYGTGDVGACQINPVHFEEARSMGLDIWGSEADNAAFATWLMRREGRRPWSSSEWCWENAIGSEKRENGSI